MVFPIPNTRRNLLFGSGHFYGCCFHRQFITCGINFRVLQNQSGFMQANERPVGGIQQVRYRIPVFLYQGRFRRPILFIGLRLSGRFRQAKMTLSRICRQVVAAVCRHNRIPAGANGSTRIG